jgi:hypothetical protein
VALPFLWLPVPLSCQTRIFLGISINYRYALDNERRFAGEASIEKFQDKSDQRILNLEGEIFWSRVVQDT